MFRFEVEGLSQLPPDGPGVVVAPHRSWLDPPCVGGALDRPVRFLIMDRVYNRRWTRWFYRQMGSIPVRLGGGPVTVTALRGALRALRSGELVGIFPEGRVVPDGPLGTMHPGAAMLAIRGQAPVIPLVIDGSSRAWPHGRRWPRRAAVGVRIGRPIAPPAGKGREVVAEFMERIRHALEELGVEPDHARRADRDR
jgi:1-acyl-sn-glycerol-3-phosphate acyltransferase